MVEVKINRGDIVLVKLDPVIGSEEGKTRPALVIQNDVGNEFSPLTIVVPITSKLFSKKFPINLEISEKDSDLKSNATIMFNQIRVIDKKRIIRNMGNLNQSLMINVNNSIKISLGLD